MAYITLNGFPLELQLPPHFDAFLHTSEDADTLAVVDDPSDWRNPTPEPWKSLILLDDAEPYTGLRGPYPNEDDEKLAEDLLRFLDQVSVTLSLVFKFVEM
jgi:nitrogen permease regulator 3-like protein